MSPQKWLLTAISIGLIVLLYNLPKVVVDNDANETNLNETGESAINLHAFPISSIDSTKIIEFRNKINSENDIKKSTIFADSLASLFLRLNLLDSAEQYGDFILSTSTDRQGTILAGDIFFKAFGFATDGTDAKRFADKAAKCFRELLRETPKDPEIRSKLAMTLVTTSNPMQGINMLREVLNDYPDNTDAMYSLGVLSMQSGQYDKAVERFDRLVVLDPMNVQAAFYLAVSLYETGNRSDAQKWFEKVKAMDNDPAIQEAADNYLKEINEF